VRGLYFSTLERPFAWPPRDTSILARELGKDDKWQADQIEAFNRTASGFVIRV
jgi:hypothetical protein